MGHRTVKRVPLDFDWPLGEPWQGYLTPDELDFPACPDCNPDGHDSGTGCNHDTATIARNFYANHLRYGSHEWEASRWCDKLTQDEVQALVEKGRLIGFTHNWTPENGWQPKHPPYMPTAREINDWQREGGHLGHDTINRWILIEARARRLGVWGLCPTCHGHGDIATDEQRTALDSRQEAEPPEGDGWQLWETTSEGSPLSPVFATPEALAEWCELAETLFATDTASREEWLSLIKGEDGKTLDTGSLLVVSTEAIRRPGNNPSTPPTQ